MVNDPETKFDGILNKTIPLILFSYDKNRKKLIDLLSRLYDSLVAPDINCFNIIYDLLDENIDNRELNDDKREMLIQRFVDRYKSIDERLWEHDKTILELKKLIRKDKKITKVKPVNKKPLSVIDELDVKSNGKTCSKCGHTWDFTGKGRIYKDGTKSIYCPKCKGYFKDV